MEPHDKSMTYAGFGAAGLQRLVKERLNPLFHGEDVVAVERLPRTASNKVMRRVLRKRYLEARGK